MSYILDALRKAQDSKREWISSSSAPATTVGTSTKRKSFALGGLVGIVAVLATALVIHYWPTDSTQNSRMNYFEKTRVEPAEPIEWVEQPAAYLGSSRSPTLVDRSNHTYRAQQSLKDAAAAGVDINPSENSTGTNTTHSIHLTNLNSDMPTATTFLNKQENNVTTHDSMSATTANDYLSLPSYFELRAQGVKLPELHIDLHVYGTEPDARFAFINKKKYQSGERISDGLVVEQIAENGAILNQNGYRFLLTR